MLAGAACFTLAPLIFAVSRGMPLFLLGKVVQGVGLATFTTAFQALVVDLAPAQRRGEALGLAGASSSIAFISAPMVGDWVATELGYRAFFQMSAVIAAASVLLVLLIAAPSKRQSDRHLSAAPDANGSGPSALAGLRLALAQKSVRASVLIMAALGIPFGVFITFLPLFAQERQIVGIGVVFSVYSGAALLVQPLSGRLSDRIGRYRVVLPGLAITSLATIVLALDSSLLVFILAGIILGLGSGLVRGGVDALAQDGVPPTLRGTAAAIQYTSFDFWIGLGSYPIGLLANAVGYAVTFVFTGVLCFGGSGVLMVILRGTRGKNSAY
jgi:MFS family permease